jgi:chemotaxis protein methyltransferase CheR
MVTFAHLNLAEDSYPAFETNTTLMDLVICRNVTIYFSESATKQVVARLYDALVDGSWLVVGHSEPSPITYYRFQVHNFPNAILYRRTGQSTPLPRDWDWMVAPPQAEEAVQRRVLKMTPAPISTEPVPPPPSKPKPLPEDGDPVERAQDFLAYGHSEEARDLLLDIIGEQPQNALAYTLLGQACANLGYWQEGEYWCRQAIRVDKLTLNAYYALALVLKHQDKLDESIDAMKKVVYIDRHYILGHFGLADLYRSKGQLPRAQKSLDNARRLLEAKAPDEVIPDSGGITAGRLKETITRQQQQWGARAAQ